MSSVSVSKNDGVSPVIGTILLVALTIVLIGITGAVLMGFDMPEPAPILGISIVQQGNITTVTHLNGAVLPAGKFKILVDGVDKTAAFGGTGDFGPGMKLSGDSGAEKVGTVSVVYIGETGTSMLISEKKIGKAGSGGGGGDIKILEIGGMKFDLPNYSSGNYWGGEWENTVMTVKNFTYGYQGMTIPGNKVYYDGGEYWWVVSGGFWMIKTKADSDPSMEAMKAENAGQIIKIKRDRLFTYADTDGVSGVVNFLETAKPVKQGTLFTNGSNLHVWVPSSDATLFGGIHISTNGWAPIGIKVL